MQQIPAGKLRDRVTFLVRQNVSDPDDGTPSDQWLPYDADVPAWVQDVLPSRADRQAGEINISARPSRIWLRPRGDIHSAMRVQIRGRAGEMEIIGGPARIERFDGIEIMAEAVTTKGNAA